jgi:transcription elongation factor Elf1
VIEKKLYPASQDITNPVQRVFPNALPCASCGSTERKLGVGKGQHTASLKCAECDRFIKWLGKSELAQIKNQGGLV